MASTIEIGRKKLKQNRERGNKRKHIKGLIVVGYRSYVFQVGNVRMRIIPFHYQAKRERYIEDVLEEKF